MDETDIVHHHTMYSTALCSLNANIRCCIGNALTDALFTKKCDSGDGLPLWHFHRIQYKSSVALGPTIAALCEQFPQSQFLWAAMRFFSFAIITHLLLRCYGKVHFIHTGWNWICENMPLYWSTSTNQCVTVTCQWMLIRQWNGEAAVLMTLWCFPGVTYFYYHSGDGTVNYTALSCHGFVWQIDSNFDNIVDCCKVVQVNGSQWAPTPALPDEYYGSGNENLEECALEANMPMDHEWKVFNCPICPMWDCTSPLCSGDHRGTFEKGKLIIKVKSGFFACVRDCGQDSTIFPFQPESDNVDTYIAAVADRKCEFILHLYQLLKVIFMENSQ